MRPFNYLHISDLHFRSDGDLFAQSEAAQSLASSIAHLNDIEFVVVTGDVAQSGKPEEYDRAEEFFGGLAENLELDSSDFYFVPGNHDVDRTVEELSYYGGIQRMTSEDEVDRLLGAPQKTESLRSRQSAFWSFVQGFAGTQQRLHTSDGLGYVSRIDIDGFSVCILGINTAWLSGSDSDRTALVMGERQVIEAMNLKNAGPAHLTIALAHHPIDWLTEWDAQACKKRLLTGSDLFLRGHLHNHEVGLMSSPASPCVEIAAGSGNAGRAFPNAHNVVSINPGEACGTVTEYRFQRDQASYIELGHDEFKFEVDGELPWSRQLVASELASVVTEAEAVADFLAGLLLGVLQEVPCDLGNGHIEFAIVDVAESAKGSEAVTAARTFMRLRNLLKLYPGETPLKTRLSAQPNLIRDFATELVELGKADSSVANRIFKDPPLNSHAVVDGHESWAVELLDDMVANGEWDEVESRSRRLLGEDPGRRDLIEPHLIQALMRSPDFESREEAVRISEALEERSGTARHSLLLAAAAESAGRDELAVATVLRAMDNNQFDADLLTYAAELAGRVGRGDVHHQARRLLEDL